MPPALLAAKVISLDAAVVAVSSELGCNFTLKIRTKNGTESSFCNVLALLLNDVWLILLVASPGRFEL